MKVYFNRIVETFSNSYVVVNDAQRKALIIDPGRVTHEMISQIENGGYTLEAILITSNIPEHTDGISTLERIYRPGIYAADTDIAGKKTFVIRGDGKLHVCGLDMSYFSIPGHSSDSIVYRIGNVLFTGDVISAGKVGETVSAYSRKVMIDDINKKLMPHSDDTIIMPGHGPMTSVGAEKLFNIELDVKKK